MSKPKTTDASAMPTKEIKICRRQHAALSFGRRTVLQHRGNRHDVEASEKSEHGKVRRDADKRNSRPPQQRRANRQADRAKRNQAGLDFAGGKKAREQAARPDADGRSRLQVARLRGIADAQHVLSVDDDDELDERGDEKKIGVADERQPQRPVAADDFHLRPQLRDKVGAEFFLRVGGGDFRDALAGAETGEGKRNQNDSRPRGLRGKDFAENSARDRAGDDGDERAEFQNAVAPGKFFLRQQLRQQAVFGRAENRAVDTHQEHAENGQVELMAGQADEREQHHEDFKDLHAEDHAALAETVGEKPAGHRK